jgi:hypothetical protein
MRPQVTLSRPVHHPMGARQTLWKCRHCTGGADGVSIGRSETDYQGRRCTGAELYSFATQASVKLYRKCNSII